MGQVWPVSYILMNISDLMVKYVEDIKIHYDDKFWQSLFVSQTVTAKTNCDRPTDMRVT